MLVSSPTVIVWPAGTRTAPLRSWMGPANGSNTTGFFDICAIRRCTRSYTDSVQRRIAQMSKNPVVFDPFAGPIQDRKGAVRVPAGHTMTVGELTSMEWAAPGVVGPRSE